MISKQVIKDLTKANPKFIDQLSALAAQLDSEAEDLPNVGQQMQKMASILDSHLSGKSPKVAKELSARLLEHQEAEVAPNPKAFALKVLTNLIPQFLDFTEEQRSLLGEYILKDVVGNTPVPLVNLATIGKLSLADLNNADQIKATHTVDELEDAANRELENAFDKTWSQAEVKVKFRLDSGILKIHIIDEGAKYSSLNERSDGLKQFVALRAFTTRYMIKKPILLVDEAEQHLHYDAQSDLVQMFARQKVASKIIYSTHSAGCLPEDMGTGVRFVELVKNIDLESKVTNKFWTKDHRGFSPILLGMGASTLAFFPTRRALVGEGPTEMLLLPTLFRDATSHSHLGFQVVPGLANQSLIELPKLENHGTHVGYFVDSDPQGEIYRNQLKDAGVDDGNIVNVVRSDGVACTIEDFILSDRFTNAVNTLIARHNQNIPTISEEDLSSPGRADKLKAIKSQYQISLSKVDIANVLLESIIDEIWPNLLDPDYAPELKRIYSELVEALEIERRD